MTSVQIPSAIARFGAIPCASIGHGDCLVTKTVRYAVNEDRDSDS